MSSLFGLNKPNTDLRKNPFDLSEKSLYSMAPGMLLPVFVKELNPGEKARLNISAITRTQPLNTSAFVRSRQYFHFFFVPFRQLWSGWDNFINGVDYKTSSLQKGKKYSMCPSLALFSYIKDQYNIEKASRKSGYFHTEDGNYKADMFGIPYYRGISRLLDMLEYGLRTSYEPKVGTFETSSPYKGISSLSDLVDGASRYFPSGFDVSNSKVNLFRALAYQKIYNDFYKRDDYEATDPEAFNFDDFDPSDSYTPRTLDVERFVKIFQLRYRWLPKDYFTGVVPSELFNVPSSVGDAISLPSGALSDGNTKFNNTGNDITISDITRNGVISTKAIRAAFAIEKQLRLTRRASGQDYISQISAHYGFTPPSGRGDKVDFIGGFTNDIDISDVISTADTSEGQTGKVYGKGIGGMELSRDLNFTAPEHGLIMCISSIVPELDYSSLGLNSFNAKFVRGDYFHPEFQDLGLQPLFSHELSHDFSGLSGDRLLGYVPRYSEYKVSFDKLHGQFRNGGDLSAWSADVDLRFDSRGISPSSLRVSPHSLNRIFSVMFDGRDGTDQFLVNSQVICKVIRAMSITGQKL